MKRAFWLSMDLVLPAVVANTAQANSTTMMAVGTDPIGNRIEIIYLDRK